MNIVFVILFVLFVVIAFIILADASNSSGGVKSELLPFTVFVFLGCAMAFLYLKVYETEYTIFAHMKEKSYHEKVSEITKNHVRTTIAKIKHECIITYRFDRELILGDKGDIKQTVSGRCVDLDQEFINDQTDEYRRELNGNQD